MTAKSFEQTYPVEQPGPFRPLNSKEKTDLTRSLRADAKKAGHANLGETVVVTRRGTIGGTFAVTVRADIVDKPAE